MASPRLHAFRCAMLMTVALGLALCAQPAAADDAAPTFKAKCAACHGADGKGETAMGKKFGLRDLASPDVQKMSDAELNAIIADGKDKMPSYKKSLNPGQIKDIVGYIRSLAKK
ncbi:MAG: c-type cytochrome [Terriglobales bacterium]